MNLVQLTPGAGRMYCGNCLRDNALVAAFRKSGHQATMVPLYLPLTLDEQDQSQDTPVFFGGLNVYLDQKLAWFRRSPEWLRRMLSTRGLLKGIGRFAAQTRAEEVGELTLSMLQGEAGNQSRDLQELVTWLKTQPRPDAFCLSNALLIGMAGGLKRAFDAPVLCMLSGEDSFLDAMSGEWREKAWAAIREQAVHVDRFIAPSRYFADLMARRLDLDSTRVSIVPSGLNLDGYPSSLPEPPPHPTVGYLARMCPEKGLDTLIRAFVLIKQGNRVPGVKLRVAGSCGPTDEKFLSKAKHELKAAGCEGDAAFHPNLDHAEKVNFLRSLSVFSVPASYGEAFGLYLIEALAAGIPIVQPRHAAFPEIVEDTGGGLLCEPENPQSLAKALESLLSDDESRGRLAKAGLDAAHSRYSITEISKKFLEAIEAVS